MDEIVRWCGILTAIAGGVAAISKLVIAPLKRAWENQIEGIRKQNEETAMQVKKIGEKIDFLTKEVKTTQDDVSDLLGDQLSRAHQEAMNRGWCSQDEKRRYVDLHKRYTARGHNHLAKRYEEDLLSLPDEAPMDEE